MTTERPICGHTAPGMGVDDYWVCILPPHDAEPPPLAPLAPKRKGQNQREHRNLYDLRPGHHAYRSRHVIDGSVSPASDAVRSDVVVWVEQFIETRKDEPDVVMAMQELLFALGY